MRRVQGRDSLRSSASASASTGDAGVADAGVMEGRQLASEGVGRRVGRRSLRR